MNEQHIKVLLKHLNSGKPINQALAIKLNWCTRLSAYIFIFKKRGMNIVDKWEVNPKTKRRYKNYYLVKNE